MMRKPFVRLIPARYLGMLTGIEMRATVDKSRLSIYLSDHHKTMNTPKAKMLRNIHGDIKQPLLFIFEDKTALTKTSTAKNDSHL